MPSSKRTYVCMHGVWWCRLSGGVWCMVVSPRWWWYVCSGHPCQRCMVYVRWCRLSGGGMYVVVTPVSRVVYVCTVVSHQWWWYVCSGHPCQTCRVCSMCMYVCMYGGVASVYLSWVAKSAVGVCWHRCMLYVCRLGRATFRGHATFRGRSGHFSRSLFLDV